MKDAVYQATCPSLGTFSETPQRHLAAEPFDARCCRGYWIKVPRSAEKIISQGRPALLLSRSTLLSFSQPSQPAQERFFPRCYVEKETYPPSPLDFLDLSCFSVDKTGDDATWHLTYMEKSRSLGSQRRNFVALSLAFLSRPIKRQKYSSQAVPSFLLSE